MGCVCTLYVWVCVCVRACAWQAWQLQTNMNVYGTVWVRVLNKDRGVDH